MTVIEGSGYLVVCEKQLGALVNTVSARLADGYQAQGGLLRSRGHWYQAMAKPPDPRAMPSDWLTRPEPDPISALWRAAGSEQDQPIQRRELGKEGTV